MFAAEDLVLVAHRVPADDLGGGDHAADVRLAEPLVGVVAVQFSTSSGTRAFMYGWSAWWTRRPTSLASLYAGMRRSSSISSSSPSGSIGRLAEALALGLLSLEVGCGCSMIALGSKPGSRSLPSLSSSASSCVVGLVPPHVPVDQRIASG
jgi:hypothetical protein